MLMERLLTGGTVYTEGRFLRADVRIRDGVVAGIGPDLTAGPDTQAEPVDGLLLTDAFADVHVHFREPGFSDKETIRTGSLAAARGGYTAVCAMPNLDPVPDSPESLALEQAIIDRDAVIEVRPYAAITVGREGREVVDIAALKGRCAAFSDDGSGVQDDAVMLEAMRTASREDCIIAAHCEDRAYGEAPESEWKQIERDIALCAQTGAHYHVCHISTSRSVELIRAAKARGVNITCETAPHYLTLCEDDVRDEGRFRMNPPLRGADDREALIEGLADGTVDVIATDHAPHTAGEKGRGWKQSAMGIVGLETAFPVLYTRLVLPGRISLERLLDALGPAPRRLFRLGGGIAPGQRAEIVVLDLDTPYTIDSGSFLSMGHATPFDGWQVRGRAVQTIHRGETVWKI